MITSSMEFWREQRVLVTGGSGFLGRRVVERLRARPCGVIAAPRRAEYDLRRNGQPRRKLDISRARSRFGFQAETSFEQGLRATVAWYLSGLGLKAEAPPDLRA
jgi:nucleoside-diphosphate-sugar epimerase